MMKEKKNMVDRFVKIAPVEGNPYLAHSAEPPPPPKNWRLQYIYIFFNLFVLEEEKVLPVHTSLSAAL